MSVLSRYVSRRLGILLVLTTAVLVSLSLSFELLEDADKVLRASGGATLAVGRYALLRLPDIAAKMLPIAALLATLATLALMIRHNELVALWNSGFSGFGVMRLFLPVAVLASVLQFVLDDRLVPLTLGKLYAWGVGDFRRSGAFGAAGDDLWLLSGDDIVRLPVASARFGRFEEITLFRREPSGALREWVAAASATPAAGGWLLSDVALYSAETARGERLAQLFWPGHVDVNNLDLISAGMRELSLPAISTLIANEGFGQRPTSVPWTWAHQRLANALSPLLSIMLAIACAQVYRRGGGFGFVLLTSLAIGFSYFVIDNVALALGESGFVPPWFGGWSAKLVLASVVGSLVLRHEQ